MRTVVGWLAEPFLCLQDDCRRPARRRSEWCETHHQIHNPPAPTPAVNPLAHRMTRPPSAIGYETGCLCKACDLAYQAEVRVKNQRAKARYRRRLAETENTQ